MNPQKRTPTQARADSPGLSDYIKNKLRVYRFKRRIRTNPLRLVIGASGKYEAGWVPSDVAFLNLLNDDHWEACFEEASIDAMLAEHVWEHLTVDEGLVAARRCFRYLKPGGHLRVAVPDGFHPEAEYIDRVKPGGNGPGADDHKVLYNHSTFAKIFEKAGFEVSLLEYFSSSGEFKFADWSPEDGKINRSSRFDKRNCNGVLKYTSIILDARKSFISGGSSLKA
jgi:predicted SAM-dependent methyltransferase